MAIRFRTVTGTMTRPKSNEPLKSATLRFTLTKGFGLTDTHLITDAFVECTTDIDGNFTIPLWCDEDGLRPIDYTVNVPKESGGEAQTDAAHTGVFSLVYGDGLPISLSILLTSSIPSPIASDLLYALVATIVGSPASAGNAVNGYLIGNFTPDRDISPQSTAPIDTENILNKLATLANDLQNSGVRYIETHSRAITDYTSVIAVGASKSQFRTPYNSQLMAIRGNLKTAAATNPLVVNVRRASTGLTIFGANKLQIAAGGRTSTGNAIQPTIPANTIFADDEELIVDIDAVGTGAVYLELTYFLRKVL